MVCRANRFVKWFVGKNALVLIVKVCSTLVDGHNIFVGNNASITTICRTQGRTQLVGHHGFVGNNGSGIRVCQL